MFVTLINYGFLVPKHGWLETLDLDHDSNVLLCYGTKLHFMNYIMAKATHNNYYAIEFVGKIQPATSYAFYRIGPHYYKVQYENNKEWRASSGSGKLLHYSKNPHFLHDYLGYNAKFNINGVEIKKPIHMIETIFHEKRNAYVAVKYTEHPRLINTPVNEFLDISFITKAVFGEKL